MATTSKTKLKDKEWLFEKRSMQKQFSGIMMYRIPIRDIPEGVNVPSFTSPEPAIYLAKESEYTKGLDKARARAFRYGVFAKEMCHVAFVDFDYIKKTANTLEEWERPFFKALVAITEDPAVENSAPTLIGGALLKSMKYAVKRTYDLAKPIHEYKTPLEQCINAMIQFGDMGPLKGRITDPKAKHVFYKVVPVFQEIMECGNSSERIDMALKIMDIMRPLWEKDAKDSYDFGKKTAEEMEKEMMSMIGMMGKSFLSGATSEKYYDLDPEEVADAADMSKGAMRSTTWKKLEDEEEESEEEELTSGSEEDEEELLSGEEEDIDEGSNFGLDGNVSDESVEYYTDADINLDTGKDYDPDEFEIEREALDSLDRLIQVELELASAESTPTPTPTEAPEFASIAKKYTAREYKCRNDFVKLSNPATAEEAYDKIVKKNFNHIEACRKKLKALFAEDGEETEYRSSGKLSVERTMSTTVTSKLFTKTKDPKDRSNLAVTIAIDESGSMYGSRIERAKEAAICLSEIFAKLGVPTYIMGYTADKGGYAAYHRHYVYWSNNKADRIKLTSANADTNNFDGYSIRYASNMLKMRDENHKILIVISDGQPACNAYNTGDAGYRDTKDAILEARKDGQSVLGVAIGANVDVLQKMYGRDFIFITTGEDLFTGIMKKFTEMVRKW